MIEIKSEILKWSRKTVAKKSELQSVLGKLLWVSKTVKFSRVFVARIIAETRKLQRQSEKTVLSNDIRKDFLWWHNFLEVFNGVELIPPIGPTLAIYGDACPQSGGSWNESVAEYFSLDFPTYLCSADTPIHTKEFIVVILSARLWGPKWAGNRVVIYCDNDAVCDTIVYQKPKDITMQKMLREFLYWICRYNFTPVLEKIGTKDNDVADFLSRNTNPSDIDAFFTSKGMSKQTKVEIPIEWFEFKADW